MRLSEQLDKNAREKQNKPVVGTYLNTKSRDKERVYNKLAVI
jgi:hypothetical protein